jgi:hypothetical protein
VIWILCAGTGGGLDTEGRWAIPDIVVSVRKVGEEPQIGVIQDALMVYLDLILALLYIVLVLSFIWQGL